MKKVIFLSALMSFSFLEGALSTLSGVSSMFAETNYVPGYVPGYVPHANARFESFSSPYSKSPNDNELTRSFSSLFVQKSPSDSSQKFTYSADEKLNSSKQQDELYFDLSSAPVISTDTLVVPETKKSSGSSLKFPRIPNKTNLGFADKRGKTSNKMSQQKHYQHGKDMKSNKRGKKY